MGPRVDPGYGKVLAAALYGLLLHVVALLVGFGVAAACDGWNLGCASTTLLYQGLFFVAAPLAGGLCAGVLATQYLREVRYRRPVATGWTLGAALAALWAWATWNGLSNGAYYLSPLVDPWARWVHASAVVGPLVVAMVVRRLIVALPWSPSQPPVQDEADEGAAEGVTEGVAEPAE